MRLLVASGVLEAIEESQVKSGCDLKGIWFAVVHTASNAPDPI